MKKIGTFLFLVIFWGSTWSQTEVDTSNIWLKKPSYSLSGLVDVFYIYDFNQPQTSYRQPFLYNHNRHNEFNLNLGFVKLAVEHPKYRANFALQAGTYVMDNYALEPDILKNIFEANVGISLSKKNKLWVDAGIFTSHIGFESLYSTENWTPTFSLVTENLPYYSSGLRLTYKPNDKVEMAAWILNGWQRIQRVEGNSMLSFGSQMKYVKSSKMTLNWSSFFGTNEPDSTRKLRWYNNLYGIFQLTKKIGLITGFDIGVQQRLKNSSNYHFWYCPVMIARIQWHSKWKSALRFEYYQDANGVVIPTGTLHGFQTTGVSVNMDYSPTTNLALRFETRWFNSRDKIFVRGSNLQNDNFYIGTSFALKF